MFVIALNRAFMNGIIDPFIWDERLSLVKGADEISERQRDANFNFIDACD